MTERKFSSFLDSFLKTRNLTVATLAAQLRINNKNGIIRILNDKSSFSNIKSLADKIGSCLELSEDEQRALAAAVEYESLPETVVSSRQTLSSLFATRPINIPNKLVCTLKNAQKCTEKIFLYDEIHNILNNDVRDEYEIYIESVNTLAFTKALYDILNDGKERNISIQQYFSDTDDVNENILQLYTLIKLSRSQKYSPYTISPKIQHSNRLNIINRTKNKAYLINIYSGDSYTYLEMDGEGTSFNSHIMEEFEILRSYSAPLRSGYDSPIDSLPEYLELMAKLDNFVTYEMKSSPCFGMLPFDIQHSLYEDSDYLGMGANHPAVKKMYTIMQEREKALYAHNGVAKNLVFDFEGIKSFLESGRTADHVPVLRPLTSEEAINALKKLIGNQNTSIYLLKEGYRIYDIEFVLFETNSLIIYDPSMGYWDNYSEIFIKNKKMLRIMRDFVNEEIIKNCCYSKEESRNIIEKML